MSKSPDDPPFAVKVGLVIVGTLVFAFLVVALLKSIVWLWYL